MPLLLEILGNICITIVCYPGSDVIKFEVNLIFLIKPFWYTTKKSRQKLRRYLENKKSIWGETKSIFRHFSHHLRVRLELWELRKCFWRLCPKLPLSFSSLTFNLVLALLVFRCLFKAWNLYEHQKNPLLSALIWNYLKHFRILPRVRNCGILIGLCKQVS